MNIQRLLMLSCATGALIGVGTAAYAQDSGGGIGEVVVTAEKREQSIQDVPVAVTAITASQREDLGIISMEDYARVAPGVVYTNNDRLTIRGIGRMTNAIGTDPAAAAYNDGVFSNSMQFSTASPMYLARTEILRGPQGTLYGRNAVAGLINVISRNPADEWEGELRSRIGNFGRYDFETLVSGPLTDNFRVLAGVSSYNQTEGYVENIGIGNDTGDQSRLYYEGKIQWEPTNDILVNFRIQSAVWQDNYGVGNVLNEVLSPYHTTQVNGTSGNGQNLYYNTQFTGVPDGLVAGIPNPSIANPYVISANSDAVGTLHDNITTSFNVSWDLGSVNLKYIGGWATYKYYTTGVDADQTSQTGTYTTATGATNVSRQLLGSYHEAQEWFSNEFNLSSNSSDPVHWIVGLYQYHQDYSQDIGLRVIGDARLNAPIGHAGTLAPAAANPLGFLANSEGTLLVESLAAFGQIDWKFAEDWTLNFGLRYTDDRKKGTDAARLVTRSSISQALGGGVEDAVDLTFFGICGGFTIAACAPLGNVTLRTDGYIQRDMSYDSDAVTGNIGLQWEPTPDYNFYARYSRGYKSGGWFGISTVVSSPYTRDEIVDAYELGAKLTFGRNFQINTSIYQNEISDMQMPLQSFNGTVTQTRLENIDSRARGAEFEIQWYPVDSLQLFANIALTDAEITRAGLFVDTADPLAVAPGARPSGPLVAGAQPQTLVGNTNVNSPELRYAVGGLYNMNMANGMLTFSALYTHTDEQQYRPFANPIYTSPANEIANFRLIWTSEDESFRIAGYVNNAFDETAYLFSDVYSVPTVSGTPGQSHDVRRSAALNIPREFGVELQFHY